MTRRRAASFIEIACPDGRRILIETPGDAMLDAVLAAIGILPRKPSQRPRLVEQHNVGNPL